MKSALFIIITDRSTSPKVICKKHVLKNFAKFTGKHLRRILFNKVAGVE